MTRSRGNSREKSGGDSSDNWLTTYSDMVTLLLAFFVLLYSFSTVNVESLGQIQSSLKAAFGILEGGTGILNEENVAVDGGLVPAQNLQFTEVVQLSNIRGVLERRLQDKDEGMVPLKYALETRGLVIRFESSVLFDSGQAQLKGEAKEVLREVAEVLEGIPNQIRVEGHTDNVPISTEKFPSNWELSVARAARVVRFLIENHKVNPKQLSAAGYGPYRPIASNETPQGRKLNRRVDIVILKRSGGEKEPR